MTQPAQGDMSGQKGITEPLQAGNQPGQPTETPTQPQENKIDVEALSEQLAKFNISTPKELEGKIVASQQAGNLANMLGDEKARRKELQRELEAVKAQVATIQNSDLSHYDASGEPMIDLKKEIQSGIREVIDTDIKQPQQRYMQERLAIQADGDYPAFAEVFEAHVNSPQVQSAIAAGQTTQTAEYNRVVRIQQKELLRQSSEVISGFKNNPRTEPPHVETGGQHATFTPSADDEDATKLKQMVNPDHYSGSNNDLQALVATRLAFETR